VTIVGLEGVNRSDRLAIMNGIEAVKTRCRKHHERRGGDCPIERPERVAKGLSASNVSVRRGLEGCQRRVSLDGNDAGLKPTPCSLV
jgi:hypothetical protein